MILTEGEVYGKVKKTLYSLLLDEDVGGVPDAVAAEAGGSRGGRGLQDEEEGPGGDAAAAPL